MNRSRVPRAIFGDPPPPFPNDCQPEGHFTPAIVPGYALSLDPAVCGGLANFAPVSYRNWLGGRIITVYIVETTRAVQAHR